MKKRKLKIIKKTIGVLSDQQMSDVKAGDGPTCPTRVFTDENKSAPTRASTNPLLCPNSD
ncbi:MAG TPA: hypothetical protein DCS93_05145 [Microscillaceae bacterium]|nr:hypothetical protein [Microscillaceae bacterium]